MELLKSPKSMYLLDAGLEVLHAQTIEWLNEISFWRDEAAFFYSLVVKKTLKSVPVNGKDNIKAIERALIAINGVELDELQQTVENHECYLNDLLENKYLKEEYYRNTHKEMTIKFSEFERRFKSLKREVFALVELINKEKVI